MGEVYRARDTRLQRDVALKVLPASYSADRARLERFEQEARTAGLLNHPNVLTVYDLGEGADGAPYLVSELLDGETLRDRLTNGAIPVRRAVEYAVQIARGLAAAHARGIVHRDLKPENLFVTRDDHVKILDFGLAKLIQRDAADRDASHTARTVAPVLTEPGLVLGTVGYVAPEQVRAAAADHRADLFAFGAILYEMLSGARAFHRETSAETMTAILKEDIPDSPWAARPIAPALERIVRRCLEKDSDKRFQSAVDLAFALEGVSTGSGEAGARADGRESVYTTSRGWPRALVGLALVALAAVAGALAATSLWRSAEPDARVYRASIVTPLDADSPFADPPAGQLALSPDGRQLVFLARGDDGIPKLWLRALDEQVARPLTGTEGATHPFWSPDSSAIAFFTPRGELKRIAPAGGPPQTITPEARPAAMTDPRTWGGGGSWGRDDVILFGVRHRSPLQRIAASGGPVSPVTTLDVAHADAFQAFPAFLPDGKHFLYVAIARSLDVLGIYVGSLDGAPPKRLMAGGSNAMFANGHLLFLRDDSLMAQPMDASRLELTGSARVIARGVTVANSGFGSFSAAHTGTLIYRTGVPPGAHESQLVWRNRAGQQLGVLGEVATYRDLDLSPHGETLAVSRADSSGNRDIWMFDVRRGVPIRFTMSSDDEITSVLASDGSRVVFNRRGGDNPRLNLYAKDTSGMGNEVTLRIDDRNKWPESISPDGRHLLYSTGTGNTDIWVLPLVGEGEPKAFQATTAAEGGARFSPDGRWVAYHSNEPGRSEVYIAPFPGPGQRVRVSVDGGLWPQWRRDQKELFYLAQGPNRAATSDNKLMAAALSIHDGRIDVGEVRPLFDAVIPSSGRGVPYVVTADGQRFLLNTLIEGLTAPSMELIVNWPAILRE
jgi:Tol biopolymer transport system component